VTKSEARDAKKTPVSLDTKKLSGRSEVGDFPASRTDSYRRLLIGRTAFGERSELARQRLVEKAFVRVAL
jgi:hypothetical protein